MNTEKMPGKLTMVWKYLRITLAVILVLTILLWGGNWIIAKEILPSPWQYKTMLNGVLIDGIFAGVLLGKNWKWRGIGAVIGLISTYAYMNLAFYINCKIYAV